MIFFSSTVGNAEIGSSERRLVRDPCWWVQGVEGNVLSLSLVQFVVVVSLVNCPACTRVLNYPSFDSLVSQVLFSSPPWCSTAPSSTAGWKSATRIARCTKKLQSTKPQPTQFPPFRIFALPRNDPRAIPSPGSSSVFASHPPPQRRLFEPFSRVRYRGELRTRNGSFRRAEQVNVACGGTCEIIANKSKFPLLDFFHLPESCFTQLSGFACIQWWP